MSDIGSISDIPPQQTQHEKARFALCMAALDCAARGKLGVLKQKIRRGAKVDFADYDRRSALHLACAEGHAQIVRFLLENGANGELKDRWGRTCVDEAQSRGDEEVLAVLREYDLLEEDETEHDDSSAKTDDDHDQQLDGDSVPMTSLLGGGEESTVAAQQHQKTQDQQQQQQQPPDLVKANSVVSGMEMLEFSARGFVDLLRERLMSGAGVNYSDYDKRTALHLAASEGHAEVAELLLLNGASALARDRFGRTPIDDAMRCGHREVLRVFRQFGAFVPAYLLDQSTTSPAFTLGSDLVKYSAAGNADAVMQLLELGAAPTFSDYDDRTPLHLACAEGHLSIVKLLLDRGARVDVKDRYQSTPLDDAVRAGHEEIGKLLRESLGLGDDLDDNANDDNDAENLSSTDPIETAIKATGSP